MDILLKTGSILCYNFFKKDELRYILDVWGARDLAENIKNRKVGERFRKYVNVNNFVERGDISSKPRKIDTGPLSQAFEDDLSETPFMIKLKKLIETIKQTSKCKYHSIHLLFTFQGKKNQKFHTDN